jgi:hypothetical protein
MRPGKRVPAALGFALACSLFSCASPRKTADAKVGGSTGPVWDPTQRYVYHVEMSSRLGVEGNKMVQFTLVRRATSTAPAAAYRRQYGATWAGSNSHRTC